MARKNSLRVLLFLLVAALLAGCSPTKNIKKESNVAGLSLAEVVAMPAVQGNVEGYSAKVKLQGRADKKDISLSGTMKLKEGEGVQVSITPLGLFEAARVEFSPLSAMLMNRMKKEYSVVRYSDVPLLSHLGLDYSLLEAVLQSKIYVPAGTEPEELLVSMVATLLGDTLLLTGKAKGITYDYYVLKSTGLLVKSVATHGNGTTVTCVYDGFKPVGDKMFPHSINMSLGGSSSRVELAFLFSKVGVLADYSPTPLSQSYKRVGLAALLEALGI